MNFVYINCQRVLTVVKNKFNSYCIVPGIFLKNFVVNWLFNIHKTIVKKLNDKKLIDDKVVWIFNLDGS